MKVAVVGTGYVGLTTAVSLAYLGHQVVGIDKDEAKIALLIADKSPIYETGIEMLLKQVKSNLRFTTNGHDTFGDVDIIVIAVGTPAKSDGSADTQFVEHAVRDIADGFVEGRSYTIVVKSTVPIGTNRRVYAAIEEKLHEKKLQAAFFIASNPEFLREGMALWDTFYPDRIVVGTNTSEAVDKLRLLYKPILEQTFIPPAFIPRSQEYQLPLLITTDPTSSEMIKYAANAFLATKISFVNEIAGLCEEVGADILEVTRGMGADPRIGSRFLQAGLGWGGSCFPKDTKALQVLAEENGYVLPILSAALEVNQGQVKLVVEKLQKELKVLTGRTIGILGLAFKPNTDDIRDAPALELIKNLLFCDVRIKVHDPVAMDNTSKMLQNNEIEYCQNPYLLAEQCDAIVLATEWEEYLHLDFSRIKSCMHTPLIIDARNGLNAQDIRGLGMIYRGIGRAGNV